MEFDKAKRPRVGLGIMLLNEYDEVLVSQRLAPDHPFHLRWQFPGGYLEFGESFEECASREVLEEVNLKVEASRMRYVATMNVRGVEFGYHNVGIFMLAQVQKDECHPKCMEPEKNTDWTWVKWFDFLKLEDSLSHPFAPFFE